MNTPFQPDCEPPPTPEPRDISLQADALSTPDMKAGQFAPWVPAPADAGAARIGQLHAGVDAQGGADPKNEDPEALGPVQNVITETLRLYPPGGLLACWPAGPSARPQSMISNGPPPPRSSCPPHIVHRRHVFWSRPDELDPHRFLPSAAQRHRIAYLPSGLCRCARIGEHLAMIESHTHVAMLARS